MRIKPSTGLSLLFFLSGATALVYQLLWVRVLYQSFGSTVQSVTTVVAAYMGGLGLGAWLFGRYADRHKNPAVLYGWLEIAIGVFGVVSPLVLLAVHRLWVALAAGLEMGGPASIALRFGLAALVLFIPTTLMGGTLPALTRGFTGGSRALLRSELAKLYGLNTLGAVVGTAVAGFFMIEFIGIRMSLWITAAVNLALGAGAVALARRFQTPSEAALPGPYDRSAAPASPTPPAPPVQGLRTLALALLVATAFASLLNEIAWTRVLVMIVGGSTYAFTLVLMVFLLGIGLGSALLGRRSARESESVAATAGKAALAQGIVAAGAAILLVFFALLPLYIVKVFRVDDVSAVVRLLLIGGAVAFVVLPPAIGMGLAFPLLTDLIAGRDQARSADVGRAYALNTLGSIAGAVLTGFVLVVVWGSDLTLRVGVLISALSAFALAFFAAKGVPEGSEEHRRLRLSLLGGGGLAAIGLVAAFASPRWDTRLIDLAPTIYGRGIRSQAMLESYLGRRGARQLSFEEGRNATVSVWESHIGRTLKVNGKADASDYGDMDTQITAGLTPLIARPWPNTAFVIGHGSGVTVRVLADAPGMREVRVAELEPAVLAVDSMFRHVNGRVLQRPGVRAIADDARSALQVERGPFDIIVSEPSNPWVAGVATLYTPEFFRIVDSRLADDGVFCQWIQLYQLPVSVVGGIVKSMRAVFPHVEIWLGSPYDLMVLASRRPLSYDPAWAERLMGPGAPLHDLAREWLNVDSPTDFHGRLLLGERSVEELARRTDLVHTDDLPRLEFVAARRFLDAERSGTLDALLNLRNADEEARAPAGLMARALDVRRGDANALPYLERLRRARPAESEWGVRTARIRLAAGDSAFADSTLAAILLRERHPDAVLETGLLATRRGEYAHARAALFAALAAGADTARARAGLAVLASQSRRWDETARQVRSALAATRNTFRHPLPMDLLDRAITPMVLDGPADTALALLASLRQLQPGWPRLYELIAVAGLRAGACEVAAENFVTLLDFGFLRRDGPALVEQCRRGAVLSTGAGTVAGKLDDHPRPERPESPPRRQ
jgi:predicted membrane-bound spermidine synthase